MLSPLQAISLFNLIKSFVLATPSPRPEGLPLVLAGLTSLFGRGRGVAPPSSHQNKTFNMLSARGGSAAGGNFSVRNGKRCDHCVKSPTLNNEFFISLIFRTGHASLPVPEHASLFSLGSGLLPLPNPLWLFGGGGAPA